jgi:hypothetical protein
MSDQVVVIGTFAVSFAVVIGYAARLHLRRRRVKD